MLQQDDNSPSQQSYSTNPTSPESKQGDDTHCSSLSGIVHTPKELSPVHANLWAPSQVPTLLDAQGPTTGTSILARLPLPNITFQASPTANQVCACLDLACEECLYNVPMLMAFSLQFPLYGGGTTYDRGWLQLLILRSELVRCSSFTLALHWSSNIPGLVDSPLGSNFRSPMQKTRFHTVLLPMLQEQIRVVSDATQYTVMTETRVIEILLSIVNIILSEVR